MTPQTIQELCQSIVDWNEAEKLGKINIPIPSQAPYYVGLLLRTDHNGKLATFLQHYRNLEQELATQNKTVRGYTYNQMDACIEWFKQGDTQARINAEKIERGGIQSFDRIHSGKPENYCASIDLRQANYTIWRKFNPNLPASWEEFSRQRHIHPAVGHSKSFRQKVFGNLNPRRLQHLQEMETLQIKKWGEALGYETIRWSADEVCFTVTAAEVEPLAQQFKQDNIAQNHNCRLRIYQFRRAEGFGYTCTHYHAQPLRSSHTELWGVPKNLFYWALKEQILHESIEPRDLAFQQEKRIAYWDHPCLHTGIQTRQIP